MVGIGTVSAKGNVRYDERGERAKVGGLLKLDIVCTRLSLMVQRTCWRCGFSHCPVCMLYPCSRRLAAHVPRHR